MIVVNQVPSDMSSQHRHWGLNVYGVIGITSSLLIIVVVFSHIKRGQPEKNPHDWIFLIKIYVIYQFSSFRWMADNYQSCLSVEISKFLIYDQCFHTISYMVLCIFHFAFIIGIVLYWSRWKFFCHRNAVAKRWDNAGLTCMDWPMNLELI